MIFTDSVMLILILWASYNIRLDVLYIPKDDTIRFILAAPVVGIPIFAKLGLYNSVIRHIDLKSLWYLFIAVTLYAAAWGLFTNLMQTNYMIKKGYTIDDFPRSVIIINWLLALTVIITTRTLARFIFNEYDKFSSFNSSDESGDKDKIYGSQTKVLIYGAGSAGVQLASALNITKKLYPVGFIDDNTDLQGTSISGLAVYSANEIEDLIFKLKVKEVLIAIPSASRTDRFNIIDKLERYPVIVRALPGVTEIAQGKVKIDELLQVSIKDLLGRKSVEPNELLLGKNITNKTVLVTGAGGSIGSELCRQIVSLSPKVLILYEINELALYSIDKELSSQNINLIKIYPILGSVNNKDKLKNLFEFFRVDTIYHGCI